jgi:hypothetical protein
MIINNIYNRVCNGLAVGTPPFFVGRCWNTLFFDKIVFGGVPTNPTYRIKIKMVIINDLKKVLDACSNVPTECKND